MTTYLGFIILRNFKATKCHKDKRLSHMHTNGPEHSGCYLKKIAPSPFYFSICNVPYDELLMLRPRDIDFPRKDESIKNFPLNFRSNDYNSRLTNRKISPSDGTVTAYQTEDKEKKTQGFSELKTMFTSCISKSFYTSMVWISTTVKSNFCYSFLQTRFCNCFPYFLCHFL